MTIPEPPIPPPDPVFTLPDPTVVLPLPFSPITETASHNSKT